jgi:enoyl-CoA hydratase
VRELRSLRITQKDQVATITLRQPVDTAEEPGVDVHWDLPVAMAALREDDSIRVVVIQGSGGNFFVPPPGGVNRNQKMWDGAVDPYGAWRTFTGIIRFHETVAGMEKPVIAMVNGDAIGFGFSIALAADLIFAQNDAVFCDHHLGMGEVPGIDRDYGLVPGDGGAALLPLFLSPCKAKEYLMLAKTVTSQELAEMGAINAAMPADLLESYVDKTVDALLRRSAFALAWTKRVANRHVIEQLNRTLDAGAAYEMVNYLQLAKAGGVDRFSITPPDDLR